MNSNKKNIHLIAGARPNFMKIAPLYHLLKCENWCEVSIIHTGQHFSVEMSDVFFDELDLPKPSVNLCIQGGTHAVQTAEIMIAYEKVCLEAAPDLVIVVGDVNSSLACAITAKKLGLKVAHLEAGLRSYDRNMPEELNRIMIDSISDILWTPSIDASNNLISEGAPKSKIDFVGNIMIDSFEYLRESIFKSDAVSKFQIKNKDYAVVTIHRVSNTNSCEVMEKIVDEIMKVSNQLNLVFPVHPRTKLAMDNYGLYSKLLSNQAIKLLPSLSYVNFMSLVLNSRFVITDSGGVQEETSYLGIPCLTLRENTERPITITKGTNSLVQLQELEISAAKIIESNKMHRVTNIEKWDGFTASRVLSSIRAHFAIESLEN